MAFTNTNKTHSTVWPEKYKKVLEEFDYIFSSSEIGIRKPEPSGFQLVLDKCKIDKNEAIFFDDLEENIKAATKFGIKSYLVDSDSTVTKSLKDLNLI